jgi:hypothetical protein
MMTRREYFDQVVDPNYQDFLAEAMSFRRAINAAVTMYHFYERIYWYRKDNSPERLPGNGSVDDFRQSLVQQCEDLDLLWDVADSMKHQFLTRPKAQGRARVVFAATDTHLSQEYEMLVGDTGRTVENLLSTVRQFWLSSIE